MPRVLQQFQFTDCTYCELVYIQSGLLLRNEGQASMPSDFDAMILNDAPGGIVVTSVDGVIEHWSKGAELIFGYAGSEVLGRQLAELTALPEHVDWTMLRELVEAQPTYDYDCIQIRKD